MKRLFFAFVMSVASLATFAQTNLIDEVLWIVGDDAILRSDIEAKKAQMQMDAIPIKGDPECALPEMLAIQKLYLHQANLDSIFVTDADVAQSVETWIEYVTSQIGSREKLEEYFNKSIPAIRADRSRVVREQQIVAQMQQKIMGDVKVTPAEVRDYYMSLSQDSLPFIPTTVEVEIVTVDPKIDQEEVDALKDRLREYTETSTSGGMQFSTIARLYSEDVESAKRGGELGFMGRGQLVPEFAAVAFAMNEPGQISRIVESEYGYHIIQLIEKRGDRLNCRHILLKPVVAQKNIDDMVLRLDSIRTEMLAGDFTFEQIVAEISTDKDTRNNNGLMVNQNRQDGNAGSSTFQMQDLPPEVAKQVDKLEEGEYSPVFTMRTLKQKDVVAFVRLRKRTKGHRANISHDFQTIKSIVEQKKRNERLQEWIVEKMKDTYIRIPEANSSCDFQYSGWIK